MSANDKPTILYRYEKECMSVSDDYTKVRLLLNAFNIIAYTPKGYWIRHYGRKRWVSNYSAKRFAYPTEQGALMAYYKRTKRAVLLQKYALKMSQQALIQVKKHLKEGTLPDQNRLYGSFPLEERDY